MMCKTKRINTHMAEALAASQVEKLQSQSPVTDEKCQSTAEWHTGRVNGSREAKHRAVPTCRHFFY